MRFYKKIFIAFCSLLMITTQVAVGDGGIISPITPWPITPITFDPYPPFPNGDGENTICGGDRYITKCDFYFDYADPDIADETFRNIELTPEFIFAFIASKTGWFCWDFDNPEQNYANMHTLFGDDDTAVIKCYITQPGEAGDFITKMRTNQRPLTQQYAFHYYEDDFHVQYHSLGEMIKKACLARSILKDPTASPAKEAYCAKCPKKNSKAGHSKGAKVNVTGFGTSDETFEWINFSTIADCYYYDEETDNLHEDNTGFFKYLLDNGTSSSPIPDVSGGGACFYSGE